MAKRLLRLKQIIGPPNPRIPICRSEFYKRIGEGLIPKPLKIGKASFWPEDQIDGVIQKLIDEQDTLETETGEDSEVLADGDAGHTRQ